MYLIVQMRQNSETYVFVSTFLSLFLFFIWFFSLAEASDGFSYYKESVVTITVNDKNGNEVGTGTGFIIEHDGIIATSCSILTKWYQDIQNTMTITLSGRETFPVDDVLSYNCKKNVAIIKVNLKGLSSLKLVRNHKLKKGKGVIVIRSSATDTQELRGKIKKVSGEFFEITVPVTPEMMGSPVLTEKGEVIGIVTLLLKKRKKLNSIISAQEIENQLARYKKYVKNIQTAVTRSSRPHTSAERILPDKSKVQIAEKPDDFMDHYLIGCDHERRQMYASAIESFKELISVNPDYGAAYSNLGNVYYKIGRYDDAADSYRQAIRISPGVPSLYTKLGTVLIILGAYKQAIEAFDKTVKIDPKNAEAYFNLGIAYVLDGDRSSARNVHKALKELDKNRAQSLSELLD